MSTIAAISTAPGIGGIGIIRISGKDSFNILNKIFVPKKEEKIDNINGYTIKYGKIVNKETNSVIDEVLVSYFKEPKSYTTEDMCEINSHGGSIVVKKILELCLKNGAILAEPGEFTKRAFLNGRIDLTEAEAIIDIINSKSDKEAKASINQLEGSLRIKLKNVKQKILDILSDIEASIDYPEYDVEDVTNDTVITNVEEILKELNKLSLSFENGKIIRDGINVAIIGKPNAGKSSLLNYILQEERAIVTEIEGTTRDTIEEFITIKGIPFKFIDTAGIRNADNKVEKMGIEKSKKVAEKSDLIIAMFDNSKKLDNEDKEILEFIKEKNSIIVLNKIDLKDEKIAENELFKSANKKILKVSISADINVEEIYNTLEEMFNLDEINADNENLITNIRHKNLIDNAIKSLKSIKEVIENKMPIDIVSINLKEALENINQITGENVSEDIIKEIFSKFCLGK